MRTTFHARFNVSFSGEFMKRKNLFIRRPPWRRGVTIEIILFRVRTGEFKYADSRIPVSHPGSGWNAFVGYLPPQKKKAEQELPVCYNTSFLVVYESITGTDVLPEYSNFT